MNASEIINNEMSLEEKLAAIDLAMANAVVAAKAVNPNAPFDPASLTICDSCE